MAAGALGKGRSAASHVTREIFTLPAFAKINLGLRVLGRRADGYHEIRTVFQTITLHDLLTFEAVREGGRFELISSAPAEVPADETNLVHRAAMALRGRGGAGLGARVLLDKRIPAGGGLGGGSSDAAAALVGLARLWRLRVSRRELVETGAELGADVPFFFTGGTALGSGVGTEIEPLPDAPARHLLVVTPGVKVSTAEAYKALAAPALTKPGSAANLSISRAGTQNADSLYEVMRNDFEPVVCRLWPEIGRAREALLRSGAHGASLSGSGSSVYGVFDSGGEARRAAGALGAEPGWQVFPCETLSRGEYVKALGECAAFL